MKIFIVFLGLLLLNMSIISFKGDYENYVYLHRVLGNVAEECAEAAAAGDESALELACDLLEYSIKKGRKIERISGYICDVYFEDGYAVARIDMEVEGLFKFPLSHRENIVAESRRRVENVE